MCKIEKVHFNSSEKSKVKIRHTCENQVKRFPHEMNNMRSHIGSVCAGMAPWGEARKQHWNQT